MPRIPAPGAKVPAIAGIDESIPSPSLFSCSLVRATVRAGGEGTRLRVRENDSVFLVASARGQTRRLRLRRVGVERHERFPRPLLMTLFLLSVFSAVSIRKVTRVYAPDIYLARAAFLDPHTHRKAECLVYRGVIPLFAATKTLLLSPLPPSLILDAPPSQPRFLPVSSFFLFSASRLDGSVCARRSVSTRKESLGDKAAEQNRM